MPEMSKLKVLDLFSGIRSGDFPWALSALAILKPLPFARSSHSARRCCGSIGLTFPFTQTYGS